MTGGERAECADQVEHQGPVQREHPDDHGGKRHEVEHDDLFPARAGARRAFPQTRAEDDREYHGGDGADREQGQADRPEPVGKTPDVARDKGEYRRRKRGHQGQDSRIASRQGRLARSMPRRRRRLPVMTPATKPNP